MKLLIIGAGGYGKTVRDIAVQLGRYENISFLDDNSTHKRVVGKCADYEKYIAEDTELYPAFGNNAVRLEWIEKLISLGANVPTIIHGTAYISPRAKVGVGSVVLPGAIINTDTVIEKGVIVNCGAIIDHGCVIENGAHICLGAIVKAENQIPACEKVEAGEVVENKKFPLKENE